MAPPQQRRGTISSFRRQKTSQWTRLVYHRIGVAQAAVFIFVIAITYHVLKQRAGRGAMVQELIRQVSQIEGSGGPIVAHLSSLSKETTTSHARKSKDARMRALKWIEVDRYGNQYRENEFVNLVQRYSLAVLYFSTGGDETWNKCSRDLRSPCDDGDKENGITRFLSDNSPECLWYGVGCHENKVIWLDLTNINLHGTIMDELSLLPELQSLWLSENRNLGGTLAESIGELKKLQSISLFNTSIGGTIPERLFELRKLSSLRIYGSEFTGSIPSRVGQAKEMAWMWLHDNKLTGTIPREIANLNKLEVHGNDVGKTTQEIDAICELRTKRLDHFWADCSSCTCCTRCFPSAT
eukprot:scaffold48344_cov49-Attheya_sp.AAC.2